MGSMKPHARRGFWNLHLLGNLRMRPIVQIPQHNQSAVLHRELRQSISDIDSRHHPLDLVHSTLVH